MVPARDRFVSEPARLSRACGRTSSKLFGGYGIGGPGPARHVRDGEIAARPRISRRRRRCRRSAPAPAMEERERKERGRLAGDKEQNAATIAAGRRARAGAPLATSPRPRSGSRSSSPAPTARPTIEFTVPDSVTSWNVWVHARHQRPAAGSLHAGDAERQGADGAAVPAALPARGRPRRAEGRGQQRLGQARCRAQLTLDILDPETNASAARRVRARRRAGRAAVHRRGRAAAPTSRFRSRAPKRVGSYRVQGHGARRATSRDGELRPLPVLPGAHAPRAVALRRRCKGGERRTLTFADLAQGDDPTPDRRAAGRHRRRAALLRGARRRCRTSSTTRTSAPSRR